MQELVWITMYITPWLLVGTVTMTQQMKMMSASWICSRSTTFDLPSKDFPSLVVGSGPGCTQVDLNTSWIIYWLTASGSTLSGTAVLTTQLNWTLTTALLPSFWSLAWELARESHARDQNSTGGSCRTKGLERNLSWSCPIDSKHSILLMYLLTSQKDTSPFETTVREVTEKVVGIRDIELCGLPTWVSDKTIHLKKERDSEGKKQFPLSKTSQSKLRKMEKIKCQS